MRALTHLALVFALLVSTPMAALCSVRCLTTPAERPPSAHCHKAADDDQRPTPPQTSHESGGCLCALEAPRIGSRFAALDDPPLGMTAVVEHPVVRVTLVPGHILPSALSPPMGSAPFQHRNPPLLL